MLDRRQFLASIALLPPVLRELASGSMPPSSEPERPPTNLFLRNGRPLLVAVEGNDPGQMLAAGLSKLPGLPEALRGKRVLVKPNATASQLDLALLRAVVHYAKQAGAAQIIICDSSSFAALANDGVFRKLGYYSLAKGESIRAAAIDSQVGSEYVRVSNVKWRANPFLLTDRLTRQADFVINLAIPKRHHAADFSCALKNNFGCTYGTFRMLAHARGGDFFDMSLVEFADAVRPNLTIVDARSILARSGPSFRPGESAIVATRRMVLSGDMVALDSYCGSLMEKLDDTFNKSKRLLRQLDYAHSLGLGEFDLVKVEVVEV